MRLHLVLTIAIAVGLGAEALAPATPDSTIHLKRRQPLGGTARSVLKKPLARHGTDMEALLAAVLALEYDEVTAVGARLADEPRLTRPGPSADSANALFPDLFFDFQDAFHENARQVSEAAKARDDDAMARSFGHLTETCVGCHGVFMRMK
jgi:hypothetical protein